MIASILLIYRRMHVWIFFALLKYLCDIQDIRVHYKFRTIRFTFRGGKERRVRGTAAPRCRHALNSLPLDSLAQVRPAKLAEPASSSLAASGRTCRESKFGLMKSTSRLKRAHKTKRARTRAVAPRRRARRGTTL